MYLYDVFDFEVYAAVTDAIVILNFSCGISLVIRQNKGLYFVGHG